jgi:hypothetical protein
MSGPLSLSWLADPVSGIFPARQCELPTFALMVVEKLEKLCIRQGSGANFNNKSSSIPVQQRHAEDKQ